jgi:hypothetical protein
MVHTGQSRRTTVFARSPAWRNLVSPHNFNDGSMGDGVEIVTAAHAYMIKLVEERRRS